MPTPRTIVQVHTPPDAPGSSLSRCLSKSVCSLSARQSMPCSSSSSSCAATKSPIRFSVNLRKLLLTCRAGQQQQQQLEGRALLKNTQWRRVRRFLSRLTHTCHAMPPARMESQIRGGGAQRNGVAALLYSCATGRSQAPRTSPRSLSCSCRTLSSPSSVSSSPHSGALISSVISTAREPRGRARRNDNGPYHSNRLPNHKPLLPHTRPGSPPTSTSVADSSMYVCPSPSRPSAHRIPRCRWRSLP